MKNCVITNNHNCGQVEEWREKERGYNKRDTQLEWVCTFLHEKTHRLRPHYPTPDVTWPSEVMQTLATDLSNKLMSCCSPWSSRAGASAKWPRWLYILYNVFEHGSLANFIVFTLVPVNVCRQSRVLRKWVKSTYYAHVCMCIDTSQHCFCVHFVCIVRVCMCVHATTSICVNIAEGMFQENLL